MDFSPTAIFTARREARLARLLDYRIRRVAAGDKGSSLAKLDGRIAKLQQELSSQ